MLPKEGRSHPSGERMPRAARIRLTRDIREILKRGRRARTPSLDLHVLQRRGRRPRIGWIVPKLGHGIVARNRVRRRLREIARRRVLGAMWRSGCGCDLLIRARRKAYSASYTVLEAEVTDGLEVLWSRN